MDSSHYVISEYCLLLSVLLRLYRRWYLKKLKRCIEARAADIFRYIRHHHHHHYHHHYQNQHHNGFPANYHALHSVIVIAKNVNKNQQNHSFVLTPQFEFTFAFSELIAAIVQIIRA